MKPGYWHMLTSLKAKAAKLAVVTQKEKRISSHTICLAAGSFTPNSHNTLL